MSEEYLPSARKSKLVVREVADEVLVYDEATHRAHCLNRTAALVWKHCDGQTPVSDISQRLGEQLPARVSDDVVWLALDRLAECDLLTSGTPHHAPASLLSRRKLLRRLGLAAAVSLPLITSIVSPTPAHAQSPVCTGDTDCPPDYACVAGTCAPNVVE